MEPKAIEKTEKSVSKEQLSDYYKQIRKYAKGFALAGENGKIDKDAVIMRVILNKDKEIVDSIREELRMNGGYCPCRLIKTDETKCMCEDFKKMIDEGILGECHCGLYVNVEDWPPINFIKGFIEKL